jgi:hypothetical protein
MFADPQNLVKSVFWAVSLTEAARKDAPRATSVARFVLHYSMVAGEKCVD